MKHWQCPWCYTAPFRKPGGHKSTSDESSLFENVLSTTVLQAIADTVMSSMKNAIEENSPDLTAINMKLEKLEQLITEIKSISTSHQPSQPIIETPEETSPSIQSPEGPYRHHLDNFLSEGELNDTRAFLSSLKESNGFQQENGHSVALYGHPYKYTGSKTPSSPSTFPPIMEAIATKIKQKLGLNNDLNSVLINHFPESSPSSAKSFLAKHSDDEPAILADSEIVTVSVGGSRTIQFEPIHDHDAGKKTLELLEVHDNSIYSMTRSSQGWYKHEVLPEAEDTPERFSLTFRSVSDKFQRSLLIFGDSNTKEIKFGNGPGTVGASYPGKRIKAAKVKSIEPYECVGYSNIFICCGTNDLRCEYIKCEDDIVDIVRELEGKLRIISQIAPKAKVFVSPVLPTRIERMNVNIRFYNRLVDRMLSRMFPSIWYKGIYSFLDSKSQGLSAKLARGDDPIHLGPRGVAQFVSHIKSCVFWREWCMKKKYAKPNTSVRKSTASEGSSGNPD